ncbi:MAG: hypothetical protein KA604_02410 [Candidatus Saccharimonas sp.]|nr:hypothetical protein [Candidatus Saccharimonas sp.]
MKGGVTMTLLQRWRDQLRNYADSHRDTAVFGPNHPAVRASRRYCERTEAQWEIGAGGRCELGKRALKQWGYEIWANIRTRWLIISLPSLGILIWGLSIDVGQTLVVVATILGALYIVVGIFTGLLADEIRYKKGQLGDTFNQNLLLKGAFFMTIAVSGPLYMLCRVFRNDRGRLIAMRAGIVLLVLAAVSGAFAVAMNVGWGSFLLGVAYIVGFIALVIGILEGLAYLARLIDRRVKVSAAQAHELRLNDTEAQAHARASIEEALRRYYACNANLRGAADGVMPSYEEWIVHLERRFADRKVGWTDFVAERYLWANYDWITDEPNYMYGFGALAESVRETQNAKAVERAALREQRRAPIRNAIGFVAATLFLMKSKVCPSVILPKMDDVKV